MKVTILTYGSRGDVQPFIPLSLGLMKRGHSVKLAAPSRFAALVVSNGIPFIPLAGNPEELSRQMNDAGYNFIKIVHEIGRHALGIAADISRQVEECCEDADLIIHTFLHVVGGHTLARRKNIPDVHIQLFPMFTSTGDYPNITLPNLNLPPLNRLTHSLAAKATWSMSKWGYDYVRRRYGLPKQRLFWPFDNDPNRSPTPVLCAWSPNVITPSRDWSPHVHVTGYLVDDSDDLYQPSTELQRFLDSGDAPICISFGSMLNRDAERIDQIVRESLRQTKNRGLVLSGWSRVKDHSSKEMLYIDTAPHQWLLPRCKIVIQHGGAGTTSAGLRAGIPNIIIPHTADQPFWGGRVHAIGAGPSPIPVKKLSVDNLTKAILKADDPHVRNRVYDIGRALRAETGVDNAVAQVEKISNEFIAR